MRAAVGRRLSLHGEIWSEVAVTATLTEGEHLHGETASTSTTNTVKI